MLGNYVDSMKSFEGVKAGQRWVWSYLALAISSIATGWEPIPSRGTQTCLSIFTGPFRPVTRSQRDSLD